MLKIREGHFDRIMETFSIIQVVFAQMFDIDVSMITVSSVEATSASAILIAFSATGSGLSMSTISGSSTQITGLSNQEFVSEGLSYTVSSVSANIAEDSSVTLELGAAKAEEVMALASFTIPLTGSTIVATVAVVTTCTALIDCTDSATPTCSGGVCVAMSCGGGSFIPDGAYDPLWDSVKPTTLIDDLTDLTDVAEEHEIHFYVDAAWGGPALFSNTLQRKMTGIERTDSVTIDGHRQLFVPMGSGVLLLKNPEQCRLVTETASYIIRKGSWDAGLFTLEGSRPENVIYMHANMRA